MDTYDLPMQYGMDYKEFRSAAFFFFFYTFGDFFSNFSFMWFLNVFIISLMQAEHLGEF